MTNEEIKELYNKIYGEKTDESNEKSKNDMWLPLLLSLLVFSSSGQTPNIELEKEVAYLHGRVDAIEKIIANKNVTR